MKHKIFVFVVIIIMVLTASSCSDSVETAPSVEDAEKYEDLQTEFEETNEEPVEEVEDASQDPRDTMSDEEYIQYLSETIPYTGMPEDYIDQTACGKHKEDISSDKRHGYRWSFDDLIALTVYAEDGKVTDVYKVNEDLFWDGDMPHLEEENGVKVWKPIPGALHKRWEKHEAGRDKDVDNFKTAEEYADYYHDDYIKLLWNEYYDEYGENFVIEQAYLDAIDHWERHQPWPEPEE